MKKIANVYTGMGALPMETEGKMKAALGNIKVHHVLDSGLMGDIIAENAVTPPLKARIEALMTAAAGTNPDVMVCTCSSIGEVAEEYARNHPEVNVLRVDYPMALYAATNANKVAVLATLSTTVEPSSNLVKRLAKEAGRDVAVVSAVAPGAIECMFAGDMQGASDKVVATAKELCADADVILLAQASMANFRTALEEALPGKLMLDSPTTCVEYLKNQWGV